MAFWRQFLEETLQDGLTSCQVLNITYNTGLESLDTPAFCTKPKIRNYRMMNKSKNLIVDNLTSIIWIVISAIVPILIIYLYQKLNPTPYIEGTWRCRTCTEKTFGTDYSKENYSKMTLGYEIMFSKEGNGTFYKIYEDSVNKKGCDLYIGSGKTKGVVSISNLRNGVFTDELGLKLDEDQVTRNFTVSYDKRRNIMTGLFTSTIGGQSGKVKCQREPFNSQRLCLQLPSYRSDAKRCQP